jgi:hypothetical protein
MATCVTTKGAFQLGICLEYRHALEPMAESAQEEGSATIVGSAVAKSDLLAQHARL